MVSQHLQHVGVEHLLKPAVVAERAVDADLDHVLVPDALEVSAVIGLPAAAG